MYAWVRTKSPNANANVHHKDQQTMKSPTQKTIKHLFSVSGNRCAFPNCESPLVEESGTVTGEISHIKAVSENGPRFDPKQSDEDRHSFKNLILLCGRHHTIIDSEIEHYSVAILSEMKHLHEKKTIIEINPKDEEVAKSFINNYINLAITNSEVKLMIDSPEAIQANTVNLQTLKKQIKILPPPGSIGNDPDMSSYIEYLIGKYQDFQKQDKEKEGRFKYMAIHNAMRREFGSKWQVLPERQFVPLCEFLKRRIENTQIGRIRRKRRQKIYHSYEEHRA